MASSPALNHGSRRDQPPQAAAKLIVLTPDEANCEAVSGIRGYSAASGIHRYLRTLLLLPILLLLSCQPQAPGIVNQGQLITEASKGIVLHEDKPFTGTAISDYPNGTHAQSIDYLDGRKHGRQQKWFEDGTLSFEAYYETGRTDGESKSWWRNGKLRSISRMERGVGQGLQEQWYSSGAKFKTIQLVDGRESGLQQSWRENGKIYNNYEARDGRIFGLKRANLCFSLEDEIVQTRE